MKTLWSAQDAAAATRGKAVGDWSVTGLSIDTRSLQPGDLFIALTDRRDGHDFVANALAAGAAAALVSRRPEGVAEDAPLLIVGDVQTALEDLGRAGRARTKAKVIGVTGSVGKTSTKEMLRVALSGQGVVHAAEKSFNNHWGVPLTLARCPEDADFAVIEIGMNHPGEIGPLAAIAAPDVAIVTIVAPAHLEAFPEGLPAIAREKAAIFSGLCPGGTAVINGDLETSEILDAGAQASAKTVLHFGMNKPEIHLSDLQVSADTTQFTAHILDQDLAVLLKTPGRHFALNGLATLAAVHAVGGDLAKAVNGLAQWIPPGGRGTRETAALPGGAAFDLLDDAYNANPTSLGAALEVLAAGTPSGSRIAVLGDMLELGPDEIALHAGIADHPALATVARVHCVGTLMRHLHGALPIGKRGIWAETADEMATQVTEIADAGDLVLVKGSLGSQVGRVVDALRKMGQSAPKSSEGAR